jgi:hypothetical protein
MRMRVGDAKVAHLRLRAADLIGLLQKPVERRVSDRSHHDHGRAKRQLREDDAA